MDYQKNKFVSHIQSNLDNIYTFARKMVKNIDRKKLQKCLFF